MPEHIAQTLLSRAHPPDVAAAIFTEKVLHKPLHLRPTSPDPNSQDARAQRRRLRLRKKENLQRHQKPQPLSAKEKRRIGVYDIPDDAKRYDIYEPLHRMWVGYISEILDLKEGEPCFVTAQSVGSKLASADYHGAQLTVVRSRCVGMVGIEGIVVKDTKFTFQVITKKNELKIQKPICSIKTRYTCMLTQFLVIPKRVTIFQFSIPQPKGIEGGSKMTPQVSNDQERPMLGGELIFELHGSQFLHRATDRATKKFKAKHMIDL